MAIGDSELSKQQRFRLKLGREFGKVGSFVARKPILTIVITSLLFSIAGSGILYLKVDSGYNDLWYSQESLSWRSMEFTNDRFGSVHRFESIIVETTNGGSVLTPEVLLDVLRLHNKIVGLNNIEDKELWESVCARAWNDGPCESTSILNVWKNEGEKLKAQNDLSHQISEVPLWDHVRARPMSLGSVVSGVKYKDELDNMTGLPLVDTAAALQVVYAVQDLRHRRGKVFAFENHFVRTCLNAHVNSANVYCASAGSVEKEAERALDRNTYFVIIAMLLMVVYVTVLLWRRDPVNSRILLGLTIILTVLQALTFSFGLCGWMGIPFTTVAFLAIFVILGIGIDDMIIIVDAVDRAPPLSRLILPEDRISWALREVGSSILLSTCTDVLALICSIIVTLPIFRYFAIATALAIFGTFILQITFFTACLALNERRVARERYELWPCRGRRRTIDNSEISPRSLRESRTSDDELLKRSSDAAQRNRTPPQNTLAKRLACFIGSFVTRSPFVAKCIVLFFLICCACSAGCAVILLKQGANWTLYLPRGSYVLDYLDARRRTFGNVNAVHFVTGRVHVERPEHRAALEDLSRRVRSLDYLVEPAYGWFDAWSTSEKFYGRAGLNATHSNLMAFLETPEGRGFRTDVQIEDGAIRATQLVTLVRFPKTEKDQLHLMDNSVRAARQASDNGVKFRAACEQFLWLERYRAVPFLTMTTLGSAVVGAFILCAIFLPMTVAALVLISVCFVNLSIICGMALANIHLNAISLVNLVMAVGFSVDALTHIAFACTEGLRNADSIKQMVYTAVTTMGPSVLHGGSSTLLAVVALAFSDFYLYRQLSLMFSFMVISGLLHGVIFLPAAFYLLYETDEKFVSHKPSKEALQQPQSPEFIMRAAKPLHAPSVETDMDVIALSPGRSVLSPPADLQYTDWTEPIVTINPMTPNEEESATPSDDIPTQWHAI